MNRSISNACIMELQEQNRLLKDEIKLLKRQNQSIKDSITDSMLSKFIKCYKEESIIQKIESIDLQDKETYENNGRGFHFLEVSTNPDIPNENFVYSIGFVLHRNDTITIVLFSYKISSMIINTAVIYYDDDGNKSYVWRGWREI